MDWTTIVVAIIGGAITLCGYIMVDKREKNKQYDEFRKEVIKTLNDHRGEYLQNIEEVKDTISDMRSVYQQTTTIVELKIDALEKKQDVHNNLITRMYAVESAQAVHEEQIKVANHRIEDLEKK